LLIIIENLGGWIHNRIKILWIHDGVVHV